MTIRGAVLSSMLLVAAAATNPRLRAAEVSPRSVATDGQRGRTLTAKLQVLYLESALRSLREGHCPVGPPNLVRLCPAMRLHLQPVLVRLGRLETLEYRGETESDGAIRQQWI